VRSCELALDEGRDMDVPRRKQAGWIEVITGSMFSGKSE
jgi:hypothetical protein